MFRSLSSDNPMPWPSTAFAGVLLFSMWGLTLIDTLAVATTAGIATVLAWLFVAIELPRLQARQRKQTLSLAGIGALCALWAWSQGSNVQLLDLLNEHLKLVMLLSAVHFISLATRLERSSAHRGPRSYLFTLGGMHLFASIANFSSVVMVGDQVKRNGTLDRLSQIILSRGFGLAVLWSPFLSTLPLVLEQVPGAHISEIYPLSVTLALLGLGLCLLEARLRLPTELQTYDGYPIKRSTLSLPVALMAGVLLTVWIFPTVPTIAVVASLAIIAPLLLISVKQGMTAGVTAVGNHITGKLAEARAEISLFLCAGLLAGGVKSCISVGLISLPFTETNATVASLVLAAIVTLAILGIHQLALVAIFSGLLADVTTTPTLMAVAYILATGLSMSGSTFSGLSFILQARFHCKAREILSTNLAFTVIMVLAGSALLHVAEMLGVR